MNTIVESSQALGQGEKVVDHWRVNGYPMHVEYDDRGWSLWVRNELAGTKYPAAWPTVEGCVIRDMGFTAPFLADHHYPEPWREAVRAKFMSLLASQHSRYAAPAAAVRVGITTLDTFTVENVVYNVELHGETTVVVSSGSAAVARMRVIGPDASLSAAMPGEPASAPSAWLDYLRECTIRVLVACGREGQGPWANRPSGHQHV